MRIRVLSDLHLEFGAMELAAVDADLVVLAGDIHTKAHGVRWANTAFEVPVLYVLGNHEFYGQRIDRAIRECKAAAAPHVHVLEREEIHVAGVRFLACTLWTDFRLFGDLQQAHAAYLCSQVMNDFRRVHIRIADGYRKFSPVHAARIHRECRQWLRARLAEGDPARTVVVTHHAPHRGSLVPEFAHDLLSAAYVSDLSQFMGTVPLWIHGHTHASFDYRVGNTRVLCNPRGYTPDDLNPEFDPTLFVEVP